MLGSVADFRRKLLAWYDTSKRDLPWRALSLSGRPDPYHVLVSEAMLQQTQVATVVPYFYRFLERFPTLKSLAECDEQEVLRLWQGLGYYSRARNLRKAAQAVVNDGAGVIPSTVERLLELPGVGRYTAGAIASIAFDTRAPILDGNVIRVVGRLDAIRTDPREKPTQQLLWSRAEEVLPTSRTGDFNSALMELGATVCTPRSPQCLICPVRDHCAAQAAGIQESIPPVRKAKPTPLHRRAVFCIRGGANGESRWLLEQRPPKGRWAGMWQFPTVEAGASPLLPPVGDLPVPARSLRHIGQVSHALTHRRYIFEIYVGDAVKNIDKALENSRCWVRLDELGKFPLPRPHVKVADLLNALDGAKPVST